MKTPTSILLCIYDFDGVMTNNTVIVNEDGKESVCVNRGDGWAIQQLKTKGIYQIIVSTEKNKVVGQRAKKLNIDCIQGCDDKKSAVELISKKHKTPLHQILYVGNDLNDYAAMRICGHRAAPQDAETEIKKIATIITAAKGGDGVIRELYTSLDESWPI